MSFTADEMQSLNDILEKKLTAHRRELERVFDQRIQTLRRDLERRLQLLQQEMMLSLTQKQAEQQKSFQTSLGQKLQTQQLNITQVVDLELKQRQQQQQLQIESLVDRAFASQLLAIEESLNRRLSAHTLDETAVQIGERPPHYEAIEVQTDLSWEDLSDIFGKVLDERIVKLNEITQATMRNWEQYFSAQLLAMQTQIHEGALHSGQIQAYSGDLTSMQEVFQSIEQLERLIESMQVAMTSNHALLSNRLYHHQQQPLERAHTNTRPPATSTHPNGTNTSSPLSLPEERPGK
jgi:hypothetical protein